MGTKAESHMGWYRGHRVPCPSGYNAKPLGIGHEPSLVFKGAVGLAGLQCAGGREECGGGGEALGRLLCREIQYFGHLMRKTDSFEKTLMLEKIEGKRRRGQQGMRWLDGISIQWT